MLVGGLRGFLLYCAPAVPPAVPLVSRQSCGRGLVKEYRLRKGPQKVILLKQITAFHSFDSGAGYRLSSLALMQAVA